jgi:hypothetical protein
MQCFNITLGAINRRSETLELLPLLLFSDFNAPQKA